MKHRQVQHSTSKTHPICYAAARRLLRSLARKSARLASWAIGLFAADMHIRQRLFPKRGWVGCVPTYKPMFSLFSSISDASPVLMSTQLSLFGPY